MATLTQRTSPLAFIRLLRPGQWAKNTFLFIPAFFAGAFLEPYVFVRLVVSFVCFSGVASSIYILNDYRDVESDRQHPTKCKRPLAAGEVSPTVALLAMAIIATGALGVAWWLDIYFFIALIGYAALNVAYSFGLKHVSILDILIVAFGFLLRTVAGGIVADVPVSQWLVIMIFLLALFLALAKRRDDLLLGQTSGQLMRRSVKSYTLEYVNACLTMLAGIIIVSYLMYTISDEVVGRLGDHLYFTSIFVIAGMMRYMQISLVENNSGSPTKLLYTDRFIQLTLLAWLASFFALIYLGTTW
ncbi:MAG: decaprenyl-phosphate phosphoribosyltransferase [Tunicatimonas sp.]